MDNGVTRTDALILQQFGVNPAAYRRFGLPGHDGVDLQTRVGDQLYAPVSGYISGVFVDPAGWGLNLRLDADQSAEAWYLCHLSSVQASKRGDYVAAGTPICLAGATGNTAGDHVHVTWLPNRGYASGPYSGRCDPVPRLLELV